MQKDNVTNVLIRLIRQLNIPVTDKSISDELDKHPDHHSLLAINNVLNNWRIPNESYALSFEELTEAPGPYIVHLSHRGGEFALVTRLDKKQVIVSNEYWNDHRLSAEEFKKLYTGAVLAAELTEDSGETDYARKKQKEILDNLRIPFVLSGLILAFSSLLLIHSPYLDNLNWNIALLTLFKSAGLVVSVLLLIQSIDANNPLIQRLCSGKNNDCNAILSSPASKLTETISWSEIGFYYFTGTLLLLSFNSSSPAFIRVLALLNLLSLPYTFYSIYFQWRIAKKWCVLCCSVQALLWLEFLAFLPYLLQPLQLPGAAGWISIVATLLLPVTGWAFIKPYLLRANEVQPLKMQLRQFKYNTELFRKLLGEQPRYKLPEEEESLILGNREAEHTVTIVSNPFCQPCSKAHKKLNEWLSERDNIKLQIIFTTSEDPHDARTQIAGHFMAMKTGNENALKEALNEWYDQKHKNFESLSKKFPSTAGVPVRQALIKQKEWCQMVNIEGTPTIFIDGHKLPKPYQIEDIKYFI